MRGVRLLASCFVLVVGCGGTSGDPLGTPPANQFGTGARLQEILGPATWVNPADEMSVMCTGIPLDRRVDVTGVTINAVDDFDETNGGATGNVYVQDTPKDPTTPGVEYSGVTVFDPGFSPPDLRVVAGDVVDMSGALTEFPGPSSFRFDFCRTLPEFTGAVELRFEGSVITPTKLAVTDLDTYEEARKWLGVLVTIENVTLQAPFPSTSGRYEIRVAGTPDPETAPSINNELFDLEGEALAEGMTLASVTGIVTFFFAVHIAPRSAADIVR